MEESKCDTCIHDVVCKDKRDMYELELEVDKLVDPESPFGITMSCINFSSKRLSR